MKRDSEGAGHRHARLAELILEELRALLRDDIADPHVERVRITALVLSVDYRHARVHFGLQREPGGMVPAARGRSTAEGALARATPFLRARLADAIDSKRVPDLRFLFDGESDWDDDPTAPATEDDS